MYDEQKTPITTFLRFIVCFHDLIVSLLSLKFAINVKIMIFYCFGAFRENNRTMMLFFIANIVCSVVLTASDFNTKIAFSSCGMSSDIILFTCLVRPSFDPRLIKRILTLKQKNCCSGGCPTNSEVTHYSHIIIFAHHILSRYHIYPWRTWHHRFRHCVYYQRYL